jgi:L-amino acid N-acyltransferase YncA
VPIAREINGLEVFLRSMGAADVDSMLAFGRLLSPEDLLLLRMNLEDREAIVDWVASIERGRRVTLLAERDGAILGYASLSLRGLSWYRHLGDLRVVVRPDLRGRGLGSALAWEVIGFARRAGVTRLVAEVPRIQSRSRDAFRRFGFQPQVLLPDWVIDVKGDTHDLVLLTLELA